MPTVLYLAHGFPPASGSGAERSLAFARYLVMYGWRPLVITPGARWAVHADPLLLARVPPWLEVVRTRSLEPRPPRPAGPPSPAATQKIDPEASPGRHMGGPERHTERHTVEKRSQIEVSEPAERHTPPAEGLATALNRHTPAADGLAPALKPHTPSAGAVAPPVTPETGGSSAVAPRVTPETGGAGRLAWAPQRLARGSGALPSPLRRLARGPDGLAALQGLTRGSGGLASALKRLGRGSGGLGGLLKTHLGHARRLPDAHVGWVPFGVWAGLRVTPRVDVLYSSSGPFSSHLVGLVLHLLTRRPWVAELRDGWYQWNRAIFPDYPGWRAPLEAWLEGQVIRRATRVVCVTERMASAFRRQYSDLPPEHFTVVPNGFDPQAEVAADAESRRGDFTVVHAGALYYGRPIGPFLTAAAMLVEANPEFARAFRLDLVGSLDQTARAEVENSAVGNRVKCWGQLDHPSTLARERAADLLLLVANTTRGAEATVPGKLFEYLASGRPVLAIAPQESATADVLARTGGGWLADASAPESIFRQLCAAFAGEGHRLDRQELMRFDRRRLAGELARVLEAALLG